MTKNVIYIFLLACMSVSTTENKEPKNRKNKAASINLAEQQKPQKPINSNDGKTLYMRYCLSCHQTDGSGVPGRYPPIQQNEWVYGDQKRLIKIMLNGMQGEIEVNGEIYSQSMPKMNYLTDKQIANVLTYIRKNFGNTAKPLKTKEVTKLRNGNK